MFIRRIKRNEDSLKKISTSDSCQLLCWQNILEIQIRQVTYYKLFTNNKGLSSEENYSVL
jgi:hypothetical protein